MKSAKARHAQLKNGNPSGDLTNVRRCGAKTRRLGRCRGPAMRNGRCRMHGGLSTGPRTPEGVARSRRANWKHGWYSVEAQRARAQDAAKARADAMAFSLAQRKLRQPAL
jgi:hypothetical protein